MNVLCNNQISSIKSRNRGTDSINKYNKDKESMVASLWSNPRREYKQNDACLWKDINEFQFLQPLIYSTSLRGNVPCFFERELL